MPQTEGMPIPQKRVLEEQLRKGESLPVGWPWRLLSFMFVIFVITAGVYAGLNFGYRPYLNSRIKGLDSKITELNQIVNEEEREKLASFYSQLVNVDNLLDIQTKPSKLFDLLEKVTIPSVYYSSLELGVQNREVKISGVSPTYDVLVQQLELFRRDPEISSFSLDNSSGKDSGVTFSATLNLSTDFFK